MKPDWIVIGPEPYLGSCKRCGQVLYKPPSDANVRMEGLLILMKGFVMVHEYCKPKLGYYESWR